MTKELSALMDDELEVHEEFTLWVAMKNHPELRTTWCRYKLIGDVLRGEEGLGRDITASVMRDIEDEPVVFVPRQQVTHARRWSSAMMALAASFAGIAIVGWLALAPGAVDDKGVMLARLPQSAAVKPASVATSGSSGMQEYILAHQLNAPGLALQGGAQHIRTVSVVSVAK